MDRRKRGKRNKRNLIEYCGNCLSPLIRKKENSWEIVICPNCGVRWKGKIRDEKDEEDY